MYYRYIPASIQHQQHMAGTSSQQPLWLLRGLILNCVRPGHDGALSGYVPSPGVAQTYAKGWRQGPADGRMAQLTSMRPADTSMLSNADVVGCILRLEGESLVQVQLVCKLWQRMLVGDPRYAARVEQAREEAARQIPKWLLVMWAERL